MALDGKARELIESKNFATVSTLREDGTVHSVVVWQHTDGDKLALNSAQGRAWPTNVERDPRITVTIPNLENPYEYVEVRGRVVESTPEGADEHIDFLAKKYMDADSYPFRQEGEVRLKILVEPEKVRVAGG
jgi:PPOX class probable F420-dependent enzyme